MPQKIKEKCPENILQENICNGVICLNCKVGTGVCVAGRMTSWQEGGTYFALLYRPARLGPGLELGPGPGPGPGLAGGREGTY